MSIIIIYYNPSKVKKILHKQNFLDPEESLTSKMSRTTKDLFNFLAD